jgi:hemoglobin
VTDAPTASLDAGGPAAVTRQDIRRLLALFYARVREDAVLGPVFTRAVGTSDRAWAAHLARIEEFWAQVVLRDGRYGGNPFQAHLRLLPELEPAMFDRWLGLFGGACAEALETGAALFLARAEAIARSLRLGLFDRLPARPAAPTPPG